MPVRIFFDSRSFKNALFNFIELKTIYRQKGTGVFGSFKRGAQQRGISGAF